jgi:hypothetical protein
MQLIGIRTFPSQDDHESPEEKHEYADEELLDAGADRIHHEAGVDRGDVRAKGEQDADDLNGEHSSRRCQQLTQSSRLEKRLTKYHTERR